MRLSRLFVACAALTASVGCHRRVDVASSDDHSAHMAGSTAASSVNGAAGLPASNGAATARLAASPRKGEWIKIPFEPGSKDTVMTWIVYPANARAKAPVVVVVHDIGGLSTWARGVADQLATEGFIGVSPDFTSRFRGAPSNVELARDSVGKLMNLVNPTERNRVITAVARYVTSLPVAEQRYGVIGYCWGGSTTFMHAINGGVRGFGGGVAYYGLPYMNGSDFALDSLRKINVPVMLFSGSKDARIGAAMPKLDSLMKSFGKTYTSRNYEGAVHGFMRSQDDPRVATPQNPQVVRDPAEEAANLAATKDAWPKTVEFLRRQLGAR